MPLRLLEVGAMPFPTVQGTQALLREQCEALARRGHEVHLLVYAHGEFAYEPPGYSIHRLSDWPRERSLRSGPSWAKATLDGRLILEIRRLCRRLEPDVVHAHNYEALVAALFARTKVPVVYHAHTLFGHELPTFAAGALARLASGLAGSTMDRLLPPLADSTLAVSPRLVEELRRIGHPADRLDCALPGIELPSVEFHSEERRHSLGLDGAEIVGYCGNLDGYQGLPTLFEAIRLLSRERPRLKLLVITGSEASPLKEFVEGIGVVDRLEVVPHGTFSNALELMGAVDVCAVPRTAPGGIPIKLLAYLAMGRPVVSSRSGTAGMELGEAVSVVPDRDARAFAQALSQLLEDPSDGCRRGLLGQDLVRAEFTWDRRVLELEEQLKRCSRER